MLENTDTLKRLNQLSREQSIDAYSAIQWPEQLVPGKLAFSHNLSLLQFIPEPLAKKLNDVESTRCEFVNFLSLNIQGERRLLENVALITPKPWPPETREYLHHLIDEENKHMFWFETYCYKYYGSVFEPGAIDLPHEYTNSLEIFKLFSRIFIFEEVVNQYNKIMAADENLDPLVRKLNALHFEEEARHTGFGRQLLASLAFDLESEYGSSWPEDLSRYLSQYTSVVWNGFFSTKLLSALGLDISAELMDQVYFNDKAKEFRQQMSRPVVGFFKRLGITIDVQ